MEGLSNQEVSIPFKRESTSKRADVIKMETKASVEFQFPSNGKAHPNGRTGFETDKGEAFQFPSNGKAHPNSGRDH